MAFSYYDCEGIDSGFCSTSFVELLTKKAHRMPFYNANPRIRNAQSLNWNLGGGVSGTSGTTGTSGTGGTTILSGGSYTWIG